MFRKTLVLSLKLSQKKRFFLRCVAREKRCPYFNLMFLNVSFSRSLFPVPSESRIYVSFILTDQILPS
jgi:hypothetical protein